MASPVFLQQHQSMSFLIFLPGLVWPKYDRSSTQGRGAPHKESCSPRRYRPFHQGGACERHGEQIPMPLHLREPCVHRGRNPMLPKSPLGSCTSIGSGATLKSPTHKIGSLD